MKTLLYLTLCAFCLPAAAQKIFFSDPTNTWRGARFDIDGLHSPYSFSYTGDTVLSGYAYHLLTGAGASYGTAAVREDTALAKVFFRFASGKIRGEDADTLEHTLYDYTLAVGDTFHMVVGPHNYAAQVASIDTIMVGSTPYRAWHFNPLPVTGFNTLLGTVIEGIGSVSNPLWPVSFWVFEDQYQLQCFSNRSQSPPVTPAVTVPVDFTPSSFPSPALATQFDNTISCHLAIAAPLITANKATLYPNPGGFDIMLKLAQPIDKGMVDVYDETSRLAYRTGLSKGTLVNIGRHLQQAGLYYYRICNSEGRQLVSGKFIFCPGQ